MFCFISSILLHTFILSGTSCTFYRSRHFKTTTRLFHMKKELYTGITGNKAFQSHCITIRLCAVLPRTSCLWIMSPYKWMFHIIVCIYPIRLYHVGSYVCFISVLYYLVLVLDFHINVIYHLGYKC